VDKIGRLVTAGVAFSGLFFVFFFLNGQDEKSSTDQPVLVGVDLPTESSVAFEANGVQNQDYASVGDSIQPEDELEISPVDDSTEPLHLGTYIDPDRGADLSEGAPVHLGAFIDPDRGPDLSEGTPIHIGEYRDPDDEGSDSFDPRDIIRIGQFIDPDGAGVTVETERVDIITKQDNF